MRDLLFCVLYTAFFTSISCAAVQPAQNSDPNVYDVFLNKTSVFGHDQDRRFRLESHYTSERLLATAVLMNTVTLLSEAADIDFHSEVDSDKTSTFDDYPNVVIDLKPTKAKDRLPACFWVWALYGAASDMIDRTKFFVSEHDIIWKGKIVAKLRYQKANPNEISRIDREVHRYTPSSTATSYMEGDTPTFDIKIPLDSAPMNGTSDSTSRESASEVRALPKLDLELQYLKNAKDLPIWTVFMMVLATLKHSAAYPASARANPYVVSVAGFDASLEIARKTGPGSRRPPFLENTHVNHAIAWIPKIMLAQRKFAEVIFRFDIDGKE